LAQATSASAARHRIGLICIPAMTFFLPKRRDTVFAEEQVPIL